MGAALRYLRQKDTGWALKLGVVPQLDWLGEHERDVRTVLPLQGVVAIHPEHDLALLRLGRAAGPG